MIAHCLAHGRRQIVDVAENFPAECRYVLEQLGEVYRMDAVARKTGLSPQERLQFHQEHSKPIMEVLHKWLEAQLAEHKTALELALENCRFINTLIDDPGFHEPDLVSRLQVRIRQLQDAYDTFHNPTLSDEQAKKLLQQVFPDPE